MNERYAEMKRKEIDKYLTSFGSLSDSQRKDLKQFDAENRARNISVSTRNNYIRFLSFFADYCASRKITSFKDVAKKDIMEFLNSLEGKSLAYTNWSKLAIKVFYRWLLNKDKTSKEYPELVSWVRLRREKWKEISPNKLVQREDVEKLLNFCKRPRDKCFVVMLWESGCRLGELLSIKLKDIVFENDECWIKVSGKTGERSVLLFDSVPYLKGLIDSHPFKDNPDGYLFLDDYDKLPFTNHGAYFLIQRLKKKAKIDKKLNPHLWRHSAATAFARQGYNEEFMKLRFGWTRSSRTPARYCHLSQEDLAKEMRIRKGKLEPEETKNDSLKGQICYSCRKRNEIGAKTCAFCGFILDEKLASEIKMLKELVAPTLREMKKELEELKAKVNNSGSQKV